MSNTPPVHVFIVDDDASFRKSLSRLMRSYGIEVRLFDSAASFFAEDLTALEGCIVLDVRMPGLSGLEVQEKLIQLNHAMPIIFLTGHGDIPMSVHAMKKGASDFLTKPVDEQVLLAAIHKALADGQRANGQQKKIEAIRARLRTLTTREHEVMRHVISGELNKQIGADLDIVEKTVKVHRARMMEKMGVHSVAELVRLCSEAGVEPAMGEVPPPDA